MVIKALDPDWIRIRIRIRIGLQPQPLDPDPEKMNTDPKHWFNATGFLLMQQSWVQFISSGFNATVLGSMQQLWAQQAVRQS